MHEAAIIEALHEQVEALVPAGRRLVEVHVEVGELEHLDGEVLSAMWGAAVEGSGLAGAALRVTRTALRVRCRECGAEFAPEDPFLLLCPACGVARPEVLAGGGVLLRSLEVEE
jgi:hydrogenase nickel incorporation protein HypA/HybF